MSDAEHQLVTLSILLQLERDARQAETQDRLRFILVNETHRLVQYRQAVLWRRTAGGGCRIEAISGLAQLDRDAPFVQWLKRLLAASAKDSAPAGPRVAAPENLPAPLAEERDQWSAGQDLLCALTTPDGVTLGGLWITRAAPWQEAEIALLEILAESYAQSWQRWLNASRGWGERLSGALHRRRVQLGLLILAVGAGLLPVRQSVLAPAEVTPVAPQIVAAPYEGVIESFAAPPNSDVTQGQLLFSLEGTVLRNRLEIARRDLAVADAEYLKASRKAFQDVRNKGDTALLKARRERKQAEVDYVSELLERIQVRSPRDGVAVFNDPNEWLGKPVQMGEKILTVADPERVELEIRLAVADAINLEPGAAVKLFLNTAPTDPLNATLARTAYEAEVTPDQILAFILVAEFDPRQPAPRIGLQGTAKLYGEEVTLFYYLFRRPIAAARQWFGW